MRSLSNLFRQLPSRVFRWKRGVRRTLFLTAEGFVFIPLMASVGFAAINTGANLLYLIFAMMAGIMCASALVSWMNLRSLDIRRIVPDGVPIDEEVRIGLEITNNKFAFHSYSIRLIDLLENERVAGVAFLFRIPVRKSARVEYSTRFERRGRHLFQRARVASRFPFGFTEKSVSWLAPGEIIVFPKVYPASEYLERQGVALGEYETGRRGQGASLFGLRDYRYDDSARFIHWKASARTGDLVLREMEAEDHLKVSLILDNVVAPARLADFAERFELAVSCLVSVAAELLKAGYQIEVLTRAGRVPFDYSQNHLRRILRAMAVIELQPDGKDAANLVAPDLESMLFWFDYGASSCQLPEAVHLDATAWPPAGVSAESAAAALREAV